MPKVWRPCNDAALLRYAGFVVDALVDYTCLTPKRDEGLTTREYDEVKDFLAGIRESYYYHREYEKERDRRRQTLRGKFEAAMECFNPDVEDEENPYLTDWGDGAELIRSFDVDKAKEQRKAIDRARKRILRKRPKCWPVMKLIIENGKDRQKSICTIIQTRRRAAAKSKRSSSRQKLDKRKSTTRQKSIILDAEKNY